MLTAVDTKTARAVRPARPSRSGRGVTRALKATIGVVAYLVLWEVAGRRGWRPGTPGWRNAGGVPSRAL